VSFRIDAEPPDDAWAEAAETRRREPPGSDYDRARQPLFDLLYGDLQITHDGTQLFPAGPGSDRPGYSISLLDLVTGLDRTLSGDLDRPVIWTQGDDALELGFEPGNGTVLVSTNLDRSPVLEVPRDEFFAEWRRFRDAFLAELVERAPELLDWHTLAPLRAQTF
jgi:hypothetical protein